MIVLTTRRHETPSKNFSKHAYLTLKSNKKQREIGRHECEFAILLPKNLSCTVKLKTLHNESHYYSADVFITAIAPITVYMALANTAQGPFFYSVSDCCWQRVGMTHLDVEWNALQEL